VAKDACALLAVVNPFRPWSRHEHLPDWLILVDEDATRFSISVLIKCLSRRPTPNAMNRPRCKASQYLISCILLPAVARSLSVAEISEFSRLAVSAPSKKKFWFFFFSPSQRSTRPITPRQDPPAMSIPRAAYSSLANDHQCSQMRRGSKKTRPAVHVQRAESGFARHQLNITASRLRRAEILGA